jgi:putative transposase
LVGPRIGSAKTNGPQAGTKRSRHAQENRDEAQNARGILDHTAGAVRGHGTAGGGDDVHPSALVGVGASGGLVALDAVFREDAAILAGPKGKHTPTRTHHHWGTTARELTFGGRRLSVPCPRVRGTDGREATLPSIAVFRERDPLTTRVMEQLLVGVSTRGYARSLEAPPAGGRSRGSSKSAVSRVVVARTRAELARQRSRRLDTLDVRALFLDGVVVAQQTVIVALAVTRDGTKEPLGLCLGSTENAVICTQLLQDLLGRGLRIDGRILCVIDGGKGLRKALADVLGAAAVIQRCQLHKRRNLEALVPKTRHAYLRAALQRAYRARAAFGSGGPG